MSAAASSLNRVSARPASLNSGKSGRVVGSGLRHAEADGCVAAGDEPVDLGELGVGGGEADFEPFGFSEPALLFGFDDAGGQVLADGGQPWPLGGVDAEQGAANAAVLV